MGKVIKKAKTVVMLTLRNAQSVQVATTHSKHEFHDMMQDAASQGEQGILAIDAVDDKPEVDDSLIIIPFSLIVFAHVIVPNQSGIVIRQDIPLIQGNDKKIN